MYMHRKKILYIKKYIYPYTKNIPLVFVSMFAVLILMSACVISVPSAYAVSNNFTVRTQVGSDTTPPTTPTALTVTPIATSQINLSWASSTDDFILSGYHVWRDGVPIATTTSVSYTDTGLSASTTYTYYITAFDSSFNESASSTSESTTTLSVSVPPVPVPNNGTHYGSLMPFTYLLESLTISPEQREATLQFTTHSFIRGVVRWGRTSSYEMGSLAENAFDTQHLTLITGLIPDTLYYFMIEGEATSGRYGVLHSGTFQTRALKDIFPPGNVTQLQGMPVENDVVLSWNNPPDSDFVKVRVVRNEYFYPSDVADGRVVYEGDGTTIRDNNVFDERKKTYYTVFSYDALGNISSGAVIRVMQNDVLPQVPSREPEIPQGIAIAFTDVQFIQEGVRIPIAGNNVSLDGSKQLTLSIPYEILPEHLKTILVVVREAEESARSFSFLLRINADKTAYVGTVAPFGTVGTFPIQISVFDFKTNQIAYTKGVLISTIVSSEPVQNELTASRWMHVITFQALFFAGLFILILFLLIHYTLRYLTILHDKRVLRRG